MLHVAILFIFISNDESRRKDLLVPNHGPILGQGKNSRLLDPTAIGQNQQVNIDVNKPIDPSLQQPQHLVALTKPTNPQASNYPPINPTIAPQQQLQGSCSGLSNLSAQKSKLSSESTQSDVQHTSSGVLHGMSIIENFLHHIENVCHFHSKIV